jgi:hypothetical protein
MGSDALERNRIGVDLINACGNSCKASHNVGAVPGADQIFSAASLLADQQPNDRGEQLQQLQGINSGHQTSPTTKPATTNTTRKTSVSMIRLCRLGVGSGCQHNVTLGVPFRCLTGREDCPSSAPANPSVAEGYGLRWLISTAQSGN